MGLLGSVLASLCALGVLGCGGNDEQKTLLIVEVVGEGRVESYVLDGDGEREGDGSTCSDRCEEELHYRDGSEFVLLIPVPDQGWYFDRWEDEGAIAGCTPDHFGDDTTKFAFALKGGGAVGCRAIFVQPAALDVTTSVVGEGTVTTTGIDLNGDTLDAEMAVCPGDCLAMYADAFDEEVEAARIVAEPAPGWTFVRFETGDAAGLPCDEAEATVEVPVPAAGPATIHCRAVFEMESGSAAALSCDIPGEESGSCQWSLGVVEDTFIITCDTEVGGLTLFDVSDPAAPVVTQTVYSGVQFTGALQLPGGTVIAAGRDGIMPWVGRTDLALDDHQWQLNFGAGLDRTGDIVFLDDTTVGVAHREGTHFQLAKVTTAGVLTEEVTFNTGESNLTSVTGLTDGYVVGGDIELVDLVEHDAVILRVGSDDEPDWQKRFASGGRFFVNDVVQLDDGKLLMVGATRPMGASGGFTAYLALFAADGTLAWHNTYGGAGTLGVTSAVDTGDGIRVLGSTAGDLLLMEIDPTDGSIEGAITYGVTGGGNDAPLGLGVTSTGGFAIGATGGNAQRLIVTLADGSVVGCEDAAIGASLDTSGITVTTPVDVVITDSVFTSTSATPASPVADVADPTSGACTPVNLCEGD